MKIKKNLFGFIFVMIFLLFVTSCYETSIIEKDDIIILYTNDVHCEIQKNMGYDGLSSYKKKLQKTNPYVTLVDCEDAIQGDVIGTVSKGEYIVDLMNATGYDISVLGNHEFDYDITQLSTLINKSNAKYLCANLNYIGKNENELDNVLPYEIKKYGDTSVAYIGVTTPYTLTSSNPANFMDENSEFIYDFYNDSTGLKFYEQIQKNIDECKKSGADYVVVCSHLGDGDSFYPYSSNDLVKNTTGIDCLLDGHAHDTISTYLQKDKNNNDVLISSTGTKLANIGQLVITSNGNLTTSIISHYEDKDEVITEKIKNIEAEYKAALSNVVASSNLALSCKDENGIRMVRNRETSIGDLVADAYRDQANADIALVNGGAIRSDLPKGDITYGDVLKIHPFGNTLYSVLATGQQIIDALEMSYRFVQKEYTNKTNSIGESGGFLQVSGLKFEVDTTLLTSVVVDEKNMFVEVSGVRRVKNVLTQNKDGSYSPIDLNKTYSVASHNFLLKSAGDGMNMFLNDEVLISEGILDCQVLINYLHITLKNNVGDLYSTSQNRIVIK